jgi:hypothetical protein
MLRRGHHRPRHQRGRRHGAVRKKYAGKTLTATITVTARDASGNVKRTKATRTVKLAKLKKSKAHKRK